MKNTTPLRKNIVRIGWGNSADAVLAWLKKYHDLNIAAIVTMADSGGSSGKLREEFGTLPAWDVRRAVVALSRNEALVRPLFEHRFEWTGTLSGHTLGNLILTGMEQIYGNLQTAIDRMGELFHLDGKVIPSTLSDVHLRATFENGIIVDGETNIDIPNRDPRIAITNLELIGEAKLNPQAQDVIEHADYIILGPGDLYTSLLPNLLIPGMCEAIAKSNARVILMVNLMTKPWETYGFYVDDFIRIIEKYLWVNIIDSILVNNNLDFPADQLQRYKDSLQEPIIIKDKDLLLKQGYQIVERDLRSYESEARHDIVKVTRVLRDFIDGWIK